MTPEFQVNLLPADGAKPKNKKFWRKTIGCLAILIILGLAVFSSSIIFLDSSLTQNLSKLNLFKQLGQLITGGNRELKGENADRINFLIIGIGGENHEGGTLADTIILASLKPSANTAAILSIPRDMSAPTKKYGWTKVDAVHAYAEKAQEGNGGPAMVDLFNDLLGTQIQYYVVVDFDGFEKVIDEFGGVDINVERDLIDYQYPIRGRENDYPIESRYEILKIKSGEQHLDGELALKYARSRNAVWPEGSDFARSRRQQKIIAALKEKIISASTLFNPKRINSLLTAYNEHIKTNMNIGEMLRLAQLGKDIDINNIKSYALSDAPDGLLYPQMVNGAYVLIPTGGNFEKIKALWQYIFYAESERPLNSVNAPALPNLPKPDEKATSTTATSTAETAEETGEPAMTEKTYQEENAKIEIQNGTAINGWASQEKTKLTAKGLQVIKIGNADAKDYTKTIIYNLSGDQYPATAAELQKIYGAAPTKNYPAALKSTADFVIILGKE